MSLWPKPWLPCILWAGFKITRGALFFHGRVGSIWGNPFVASIVVFLICFQVAGPWTSTHFYLRSSEVYFWTLCCFSGLFWVISEGAGWTSCVHSRSRRGCPPNRWQLCPPMAIYPKIHSSINPNIYNIPIHISINLIIHPPLPRAARSKPLSLPLLHAGQVL